MRSKRQQTMAKHAREQAVRERRVRKQEKKQAAAARKADGLNGDGLTPSVEAADGPEQAVDGDALGAPSNPSSVT